MTNETNDDIITSQNNDEEVTSEETAEDHEEAEETSTEGEKKDKPFESPEDRLVRLERQASRLRKKLGKDDKVESKKQDKSGELDYGQLAYLTAKGIEHDQEIALVHKVMAATGKSLKEVVATKYFQAELKELREARSSADAVNAVSKASGRRPAESSKSVDYWLKKDFSEVPPELKREVLNARIKQMKEGSKFSSNPIVTR